MVQLELLVRERVFQTFINNVIRRSFYFDAKMFLKPMYVKEYSKRSWLMYIMKKLRMGLGTVA